MAEKKFKWGVLGPGRIAHEFARGVQVIEGASIYAVASKTPGKAEQFAAQYGGAKTYSTYEDLVNDPEVDGVYVATPHRYHFENTMIALSAGKPVLCEKPLTVNAKESKELFKTAKEKKVFLMEALWTRFLPIYSVVRKWLDDKTIGELSLLAGTFGFNAPKEKDDRWQNHELAGGTLLDMGVYPIAISQWVMKSNPKSFFAMSHIGHTGVDELTTFLLKYENDVISQSHSSFMSNHVNDFWIYGSKGRIRIHPNFWGSTKATLLTDGQEITVEKPFRASGFEYQTEEAMRCIRAGLIESPSMTHADTLANMELMDAIRTEIGLKYSFER